MWHSGEYVCIMNISLEYLKYTLIIVKMKFGHSSVLERIKITSKWKCFQIYASQITVIIFGFLERNHTRKMLKTVKIIRQSNRIDPSYRLQTHRRSAHRIFFRWSLFYFKIKILTKRCQYDTLFNEGLKF